MPTDYWGSCPQCKENSAPGTQQSVVTELVAIVEEEHLDIGGESGHMMAHRVQDELVRSVLGGPMLILHVGIVASILSLV